MASFFAFSNDIKMILTLAKKEAYLNNHQTVSTAHIFLAVNKFLKENQEKEGYSELRARWRATLSKDKTFDGEKFKEAFFTMFPAGPDPEPGKKIVINAGIDLNHMLSQLEKITVTSKREVNICDLIHEMFSDTSYDIHRLFSIMESDSFAEKISENMREEFAVKAAKIETIEDLDSIDGMTNLNSYVKEHPQALVGMSKNLKKIELGLNCKIINCIAIVGKAGTGKTALVYAFADAINKGETDGFNDKIIYQLDMAQVVAGCIYRGQFEEKLTNIIEAVKEHSNVILFIDEFHQVVGSGASKEGSMDGANILKPYITRGEITIIGATTDEEYAKELSKDKAFRRRFHKVLVSEPSKAENREILEGVCKSFEEFFGRKASEELVDKVVELSMKYSVEQANPARSINMLDLAFSHSKTFNSEGEIVFDDDALKAIQTQYDIHASDTAAEDTEKYLRGFILGQDPVIDRIAENLRYVEYGLTDPEKPLVSMLFGGPTGVGKTEACKIIADHFFGSNRNFVKLNMGEYASEMDLTKLTGSAPGYLGSDDEGDLIKSVKQNPRSIVVFDEIEKAHPKIMDALLAILDTGEMKTNKGEVVSFRNTIIVFTTNLGYKSGFSEAKGIGFYKSKTSQEDILESIKSHMRPEFFNRIDDVIIFNGLTDEIADTLIDRYVKDYEENSGFVFKLLPEDYEAIRKDANIKEYGARGLKRSVRKQILTVLKRTKAEEKKEEVDVVFPLLEKVEEASDIMKMNRQQLLEEAKSLGISGCSRMKKEELLQVISEKKNSENN